MSITIFLAVLLSALIHASWNAIAKSSHHKIETFVLMSATYALLCAPVVLATPFIGWDIMPILATAALFHTIYRILLCHNYKDGDLSFVYPICRGSAPLIVFVMSALILQEIPNTAQGIGIFIICSSILTMALIRAHHRWETYFIALATGFCIAAYSFLGGWGARITHDHILTLAYIAILDKAFFMIYVLLVHRGAVVNMPRLPMRTIGLAIISGALSLLGYGITVWAMRYADMTAITALRASSILFATLIGVFMLKETISYKRAITAIAIFIGIVFLKI